MIKVKVIVIGLKKSLLPNHITNLDKALSIEQHQSKNKFHLNSVLVKRGFL
jgi:hypothetical protein